VYKEVVLSSHKRCQEVRQRSPNQHTSPARFADAVNPRWTVQVAGLVVALTLLLIGCSGSAPARAPVTTALAATSAPNVPPVATGQPGSQAPISTIVPATSQAGTTRPTSSAPLVTGKVIVFAAASLTDAFNELKIAIEQSHQGAVITYTFAGSPILRTQLAQGAHADVFAPADEPTMQGAQKDNSVTTPPRFFAQNKLIVIVPIDNRAGVTTLADLARPGVKLVLAQKDVPAGNYARQALSKLADDSVYGTDFSTRVLMNLKSDESNVKDVVAKVQLGEADAGIVYRTDITLSVRTHITTIDIPDQFNVIARYPIALVRGGVNEAGARAFIDYVLSPGGQAILARYGFLAP